MKTIFSKRFMAPLAVMILGGAGAFLTTSMNSTKAIDIRPGYRFLSEQQPCHKEVDCTIEVTDAVCTVGVNQLYDKSSPNTCDIPLYRIEN